MGVPTTLRGISGTASNNSPAGTDAVGSTADDYLRGIQASIRQYLAGQSATVVAAATTDLTTATGHWVPISGNTTITGLGSEDAGIEYILNFTGTPVLINSTALALPGGATVQAATADVCVAESLGSGNWKLWGYTRAASAPSVFESGTWTPSVGGTATYTTQTGNYTKIGNRVFFDFVLQINAIGTGSTSTISGLPATSTAIGGATIVFYSSLATNTVYLVGDIASGGTSIQLNGANTGGTAIGSGIAAIGSGTQVIGFGHYKA